MKELLYKGEFIQVLDDEGYIYRNYYYYDLENVKTIIDRRIENEYN